MTVREIAEAFAALCKAGKHEEAGERFWSDDIVSREAMEGPMAELRGRAAVKGKGDWWYSAHERLLQNAPGCILTVVEGHRLRGC